MLRVRVSIKPSPIHGLGCFAEEPIHEGQVVWVLDEDLDVRVPAVKVPHLPAPVREFLSMYGYATIYDGERVIVLCGDHGKHMNHSPEPNLLGGEGDAYSNVAARDIAAGEELTCNYYEFDLDADLKLAGAGNAPAAAV